MTTNDLTLAFADEHPTTVSPRAIRVDERISTPFTIQAWLRSSYDSLDLDRLTGMKCVVKVGSDNGEEWASVRYWSGVCTHIELVHAERGNLSTYSAVVAPDLWLLGKRTNHRIFQQQSALEIVRRILDEWNIDFSDTEVTGTYPRLDYRVQYGESDLAFVSRMLEEWGISYTFRTEQMRSRLILMDTPETKDPAREPLVFTDQPTPARGVTHARNVRIFRKLSLGSVEIRDYDFRNPGHELRERVTSNDHDRLESHLYEPGSSVVIDPGANGHTPVADSRGPARSSATILKDAAQRRLNADRAAEPRITLESNTTLIAPGEIVTIQGHPRQDLSESVRLLVTATSFEATTDEAVTMAVQTVRADKPFEPPFVTPKPSVFGVQSATVVGPDKEEIHTDEFGRVRVQFPWDREGHESEESSCWMRVSQAWAGAAYGVMMVPRIGQEVLVSFLQGDPDQPVVVGRLFNGKQVVPYPLPQSKTKSGWKSSSTPGGDGFNEMSFEDAKGRELLYMHAQRDHERVVLRNERHRTRRNRSVTIGRNHSKRVGNDEREQTGNDRFISVGRDLDVAVERSRFERTASHHMTLTKGDVRVTTLGHFDRYTCGGRREETRKGRHTTIGTDSRERIGENLSQYVGGDMAVKVMGSRSDATSGDVHLYSGGTLVLEAERRISLKVQGAFIDIQPHMIAITAPAVVENMGSAAMGWVPHLELPTLPLTYGTAADECRAMPGAAASPTPPAPVAPPTPQPRRDGFRPNEILPHSVPWNAPAEDEDEDE